MTRVLVPQPDIEADVSAEQVVAYLLRPGSRWAFWGETGAVRAFVHEEINPAMVLVGRNPSGDTIGAIAEREGRHPSAMLADITGPARGVEGARCRGADTREDYDPGRVACMVKTMARRWKETSAPHGATEGSDE